MLSKLWLLIFIANVHILLADATQPKVFFYFKALIPQKGNVFGKCEITIFQEGGLKFRFNVTNLYMDFEHPLTLNFMLSSNDGTKKIKEPCDVTKSSVCDVATSITDGSAQANLENEFGDIFGLFYFKFSNAVISDVEQECKLAELSATNLQCTCNESEANLLTNCERAMPKKCGGLPTRKMEKLKFKVPAIRLYLEEAFQSDTVVPRKLYAFDDAAQQYYTVSWEKSEEDAQPQNSQYIALKLRITPTGLDVVPETRKSNFIMTNFDVQSLILFDNAFCSPFGTNLICACCELNWNDDDYCATKHKPNEVFFSSAAFIQSFGYITLNGQAWTDAEKIFRIQFEEFRLGTPGLLEERKAHYEISAQFERSVNVLRQCTNPALEGWCATNITNPNIKSISVSLRIDVDTFAFLDIPVLEGKIQKPSSSCLTEGLNDNKRQCLCENPIAIDDINCRQLPTMCDRATETKKYLSKQPVGFQLEVDDGQYNYLQTWPVQKPVTILAKDTSGDHQNNQGYVIRFDPMYEDFPAYGPADYWPMNVWVTPYNKYSGDQTTTIAKQFKWVDKQVLLFGSYTDKVTPGTKLTYGFCSLKGNKIDCGCCSGAQYNKNIKKCKEVSPYAFDLSYVSPPFGFVYGSGTVWSTNTNLVMLWTKKEPYSDAGSYQILDQNSVIPCEFDKLCQIVLTANMHVNVDVSVDNGNPLATGNIPIGSSKNIDGGADKVCLPLAATTLPRGDSAQMCLCDPKVDEQRRNCVVEEPRKCFEMSHFDPPTDKIAQFNFQFDKGKIKEDLKWQTTKIFHIKNQKDEKVLRVYVEAIDGKVNTQSANPAVFFLRIHLALFAATKKSDKIYDGKLNWIPRDYEAYLFNQASCVLKDETNGMDNIECTCCEKYTTGDVDICVPQTEILSQTNVQFSVPIKDNSIGYGHVFGRFSLTLDENHYFTIRWLKSIDGYTNSVVLYTKKSGDPNEVLCDGFPVCFFRFGSGVEGEELTMSVVLKGPDGTEQRQTSTPFLKFNVLNDRISEIVGKTECQMDSTKTSCLCPNSKDFDPAICGTSVVRPCSSITPNTNEIGGKSRQFPTFLLTLDNLPAEEGKNVYAASRDKSYFAFSYRTKKRLDAENKQPNFLIYLNPTQQKSVPTPSSLNNKIEMNFDLPNNIVIFDDAYCSQNSEKTSWLCQCCLIGSAGCSNEIADKAATTAPPDPDKNFDPNADQCSDPNNQKTNALCIDAASPTTKDNIDQKIENVNNQTVSSFDAPELNILSTLFEGFSNVTEVNSTQREKLIDLFDQTLSIKDEAFKANGRKVCDSLLASIDKIISSSSEDLTFLTGKSIGINKKTVTCADEKRWFGLGDDKKSFWSRNDHVINDYTSITLSIDTLCTNKVPDATIPAYFMIFRNGKLFMQQNVSDTKKTEAGNKMVAENGTNKEQTKRVDRCKKVFHPTNDIVLRSVVLDKVDNVLTAIHFKKGNLKLPIHSKVTVTWWDKNGWAEKRQCKLEEKGDEYIGKCDHLTDFSMLVEHSPTDPLLCNHTLDELGFAFCLVSLISLFILALIFATRLIPVVQDSIFIQVLNNSKQSGNDSIIIGYISCMILFYFMFLVFIDQKLTNSAIFCKLTAAFLYDLFLTAMFLNLFQAWAMIKACAWTSEVERILQVATHVYVFLPVSFGLPFLVVLIIWFADPPFFNRGDQFCWIHPQSVIYGVLIPVTLMLFNSFVTFVIFCIRMFPDFFARFGIRRLSIKLASSDKKQRKMKMELFAVILFAQLILGFPWILQYPAMFFPNISVWHYLFAIFNGLNGFFIFFIYIFKRVQVFYKLRTASSYKSHHNTASSETH